MTRGPFFKKILIFSIPLILTGLLQLAYNTADVIVVGKFVGTQALAAVGSTGSLINLFLNLFMGLSVGSGVMIARHIGEQSVKKIQNCVHTAMLISIICGFIIGIAGFFLSSKMLILMKAPDDVLPLASLYLKIYFLGSPGSMVYNFGSAIVRATGDTKRPFFILGVSGAVNVFLNLIFVIVFHFGVEGVAIPTIISQYLSAIMICSYLMRIDNPCRLTVKKLKIHSDELISILKIGVPAGIQGSLFSFSNVVIQSSVNSFGSAVMAGTSAGSNYEGYIYTCTNCVAQTAMTFSSQNMGARRYSNMGKVYRRCLLFALGIGVVMGIVGIVFCRQIVGLFSKDSSVIQAGAERMLLIMPFYFFCSLMDVAASQLRGMGKSIQPMIVTLLGACGLRIAWMFFILPMRRTATMLYMAYPVSWIVTFIAQFISYFIFVYRMKKKG